jgi:hypothetical protein
MLSERLVVARGPRFVKQGLVIALLALMLGSVIGFAAPTAHAASSCTFSGWTSASIPDTENPDPHYVSGPNVPPTDLRGHVEAYLQRLTDSNNNYCGVTVNAVVHVGPGSHGSDLWAGVYSCSGQYLTGTNVLPVTGNGTTNQTYGPYYTAYSSLVSPACAYGVVEIWYYDNNHNKVEEWQYTTDLITP